MIQYFLKEYNDYNKFIEPNTNIFKDNVLKAKIYYKHSHLFCLHNIIFYFPFYI